MIDYRFIARVVNVDDPEKAGRVQIRAFGTHDDTAQIPDSDLPWARCQFPVTNAMHGGAAGPTTGLVKGSIVRGEWVDSFHQIPIVVGVLGRSTTEDGKPGDFPPANRGDDLNSVLNVNLVEQSATALKYRTLTTIGPLEEAKSLSPFGEIKDVLSTVSKLRSLINNADPSQIINLINGSDTSIGGTIYTTASSKVASIASRLSKETITSSAQAINRVNGSSFQMGTTMSAVESTLKKLKGL